MLPFVDMMFSGVIAAYATLFIYAYATAAFKRRYTLFTCHAPAYSRLIFHLFFVIALFFFYARCLFVATRAAA